MRCRIYLSVNSQSAADIFMIPTANQDSCTCDLFRKNGVEHLALLDLLFAAHFASNVLVAGGVLRVGFAEDTQ